MSHNEDVLSPLMVGYLDDCICSTDIDSENFQRNDEKNKQKQLIHYLESAWNEADVMISCCYAIAGKIEFHRKQEDI